MRCAVAYYGTRIAQLLDRRPRVPVQYHFGERDRSIPADTIDRIRAAHPDGEFHVYAPTRLQLRPREAYDAAAAKLRVSATGVLRAPPHARW